MSKILMATLTKPRVGTQRTEQVIISDGDTRTEADQILDYVLSNNQRGWRTYNISPPLPIDLQLEVMDLSI